MRKCFSILLCVLMLTQYVPMNAFASAPAEDGLCEHHATHTADCGYAAAVAGADCTYHCQICHVQELVDALPEEVTAENVETVKAKLTAIDNEKASLSDEELAQVDFAKYTAAISAINELSVQSSAQKPAPVEDTTHATAKAVATAEVPDFEISNGVLVKYNGTDENVVIPDGVTQIGEYAFVHCDKIITVTIPDSVTIIGRYAFAQSSLRNISIPSSVTTIGEAAFLSTSIQSIIIPSSVTSIGRRAFLGCSNLTYVEYWGASNPAESVAFTTTVTEIYVTDDYTDKRCCRKPATVMYYTLSATADPAEGGRICGLTEGKCKINTNISLTAKPNAGYTFVGWTKNSETVSTNNPYEFTMPANAVSLNAVFAKTPPEITGISVTVDGKTYTSGSVTITSGSTVSLTVTGTGLVNLDGQAFLRFAPGKDISVETNGWSVDAYGTTATCDFLPNVIDDFSDCKDFEVKYSNTRNDYQSTGIYLTYCAEHSGGTATCTEKAICSVCSKEYGDYAAHAPDANGKCTVCGYQYTVAVDTTYYESFEAAIEAYANAVMFDGTLVVLADTDTDTGAYAWHGSGFTINSGVTLTNNGTLTISSSLTNNGSIVNNGTLNLPISYTWPDEGITGGTVNIGEKSYTWDSEKRMWICGENSHSYDETTHVCSICGKVETFTVYWAGSNLELQNGISTYGQDFVQTISVPEKTHLRITNVTTADGVSVNYTYENGVLTIAAKDVPAANIDVVCNHYVEVTFHANGGVIKPEKGFPLDGDNGYAADGSYWVQEILVGGDAYLSNYVDVTRTGYTFIDWRDASGQIYPMTKVNGAEFVSATEDVTVSAQWQANTYTVKWDVDGETYATTEQTYDAALVLPTAPTKTGYIFDGWYTAVTSDREEVTAQTVYGTAGESTYYADWTECDHSGNTNDYADNGDGTHDYVCSGCEYTKTEDHTLTYSADGSTITASCSANCGHSGSVTITAENKLYDGTAYVANVTKTGILKDETFTVVYSLTKDGQYTETIPTSKNAGDYTVWYYVKGDSNHSDSTKTSVKVTIGQKELTAAVTGSAAKTYDGTNTVPAEPGLSVTLTGIVGADDVKVSASYAYDGVNVGTTKINATGITLSGADADNYTLKSTTASANIGEITQKSVTITAKDQTIPHGTEISNTEITAVGLINGHSVTAVLTPSTANVTVNGTITASAAVITADGTDVSANYEISYGEPAKLVIEPDTSKINGLTTANVTSANEADIKAVQEMMENADSVKDEWAAISTTCENLIDKIEAVRDATDTENTEKVEDVTADNVKPEDQEALKDAKADLEKALEDNAGNYTEEEKKAIQDEIQRIEDAMVALENAQDVTDAITQLPETVEPDDEEAAEKILGAKEAYDELTDHEKSLMDETIKKKLDDLVAALTAYDIIKGDGGKWTKDSSSGLSFTANGPFSKFIGIEVDGKEVDGKYYDAKAGSTIITLKQSFLKLLSTGEHTVTVLYTDGETSGTFKILAASSTPATSDDSNIMLYSTMLTISFSALVILILASKKRKQRN